MRKGRLGLFKFERCFRRAALGVVLCAIFGMSHIGVSAENPAAHGNAEARQTRTASQKNLRTQTLSAEKARLLESFGKLPLRFEANRGQTDSRVKFLSQGRGYTLFLTGGEAVLTLAKPAKGDTAKPARDDRNDASAYDALRVKLLGANADPAVAGLDELSTKSNYFIGRDPKKWRTNVPNYGKVQYKNVYPGVDLVYYGNQQQLEYDWVVAPGADPKAIRFEIVGADLGVRPATGQNGEEGAHAGAPLQIAPNGDLVISTDGGEVRFRKPVVYQLEDSKLQASNRKLVEGRYSLHKHRRKNSNPRVRQPEYEVAFEIAAYDASKPLIIDPLLSFSTFLGGGDTDWVFPMALDSSGNIYVAGNTDSADFPTTIGAFDTTCGTDGACNPIVTVSTLVPVRDAFVSKLDPTGTTLLFSTYLGGSSFDQARGLAVDSSDDVYVTGFTFSSSDFPTTSGAFSTTAGTLFLTKLDSTGSSLVYSALFGGSTFDEGRSVAVDSSDNAFVTGITESTDFPTTTGAFQETTPGGTCGISSTFPCDHGFVFVMNVAGSAPVYSTYLGGSAEDFAGTIRVDGSGNAYIAGYTNSTDFPTTTGAFQETFGGQSLACDPSLTESLNVGCGDVFVTELNPSGSAPVFSTFLGGSGDDSTGFSDSTFALDDSGNIYLTGSTNSSDFPVTPGAFQTVAHGGTCGTTPNTFPCNDAFVTKLNPAGSAQVYSTYLGGSGDDEGGSTAVDSAGNAYVVGLGDSTDFPLASALQTTCNSCSSLTSVGDLFITKLNAAGTATIFSTYLGGSGFEQGNHIIVDSSGNVYIAGLTSSSDFPTTVGAYQTTFGGVSDAFVAKLSDLALPVATVTPNPLPDFGTLGIGFTSTPQTVTLKNDGDNSLGVFSIAITSDIDHPNASDFTISSGTCSLASFVLSPGASCTIDVTFKPTATGTRGALLDIADNIQNPDGSPPPHHELVTLTGTGTPAPAVSLSTSALFFAPRVIGTTSAGQMVTLTNLSTATAALNIASITRIGDFAIVNNTCPAMLGIGANCSFKVTFTPTVIGFNSGSVIITSDAPSSPDTVTLSGTGLSLGMLGSSTTSVNFGTLPVGSTSGPKTVILNNAGSGPLGISSVLNPTPPFTMTTTCGSSIAAGGNCKFTLTYKPIVLGPVSGTLTITHDDSITPLVINLSGTGGPVPFARGEVFVSVGSGLVQRRSSTGSLIQVLDTTGGGFTTGMAFDATGNLYVTNFSTSIVSKFDGNGNRLGSFGSGYSAPESIVFDAAGDVYVGNRGGGGIRKFDADGNFLTVIIPGTPIDWMDLAGDQKTMLYTQEGQQIHTVDVSNDVAGPDFATNLGGSAFALRILGDGGVLLANGGNILRLSSSGQVIQTYDAPGEDNWFALNLDPDGTSFWSASFGTSNVYKFDIASGTQLLNFNTNTGLDTVFGLVVKGEITAAQTLTLTLSTTALTMPDTPINLTCVPRTVTLTNTGQGPVTISSIATSSAEFVVLTNTSTNPCGTSLAAGANCTVSVVFHPAEIGTRTGKLTITSDATGSPHVVTLTGEGKPLCLLQAVVPTLKVVEGTDSATFDIFHEVHGATELIEDPNVLACVDTAPVRCSFDPPAIQSPQHSRLTVENLRAVGGSSKALKVTGNSAEEKHTMWVQVLFADFSFTKYPNEVSVKAGETARYALSIVPVNGLAGRMALKCTGVPVGTSCTVTPGEVTLEGGPVQVAVKVGTTQRGGIVRPPTEMAPRFPAPDSRLPIMLWSILAVLAAAATGLAITKKKAKLALGLAMLCVVTWGSCGGGGGVGPAGWQGGTPLGTHTLVIQGTLTTPGAGVATDANTPPLTHETQIVLKVN